MLLVMISIHIWQILVLLLAAVTIQEPLAAAGLNKYVDISQRQKKERKGQSL